MKRYAIIIAMSLLTSASFANDVQRGRISTFYHNTTDRLSNHKGKVGLAAGAIGFGIINKVFSKEIDEHVKPLIKKIWNKTTGWLKRVFRSQKG